ncbi:collagen alpha-1(I) chain-like [Lemur catta]|uniref:collagen alpha-1(I) chain-like n=1 Tax=Lemur catta TaxID=9447 RepID=UPI001E26E6E8|nr:collagen alpha-1(I) chain-like [Lemur catta]
MTYKSSVSIVPIFVNSLQYFKHRTSLDRPGDTAEARLNSIWAPGSGSHRWAPCGLFLGNQGGPSSLARAGARGRSGFPRILDLARWSAEPGTGRGTGPARAAAEAGSPRRPGLGGECGARAGCRQRLREAVPVFPQRWPLRDSICQRSSCPLLLWPGRAALAAAERTRDRRGEPTSCQASGEAARGLREAHKGHGGRRRRKAVANSVLQLRSGWVRGRGDNAAGSAQRVSECGAPALPGPQLDRPPARPAPSRGRGAPSLRRPEKEVGPRPPSPATCEPGKVCGASAGRHGLARPSRPRPPRVTFSARRQPGPQRGRRGLRGGPESARGFRHPCLRPW